MKKWIAVLLSVILASMTLFGCAGNSGTGEPSSSPEPVSQEEENPMPKTKVDKLLASISEEDSNYYFKLAEFAVSDVLDHFWDFEHNHAVPTWNGLPATKEQDPRGSFWETGQCLYTIYDMYVITGDSYYEKMLQGQAKFIKDNFTIKELTAAGGNLNWAVDDCAWNCMIYMIMYDVTGDKWFIEVTDGLIASVLDFWGDEVTGGGMWYNSNRQVKSVYQLGVVMSMFRLWQITGEQRYYDMAFEQFNWMQEALTAGREDGLYYTDIYATGPRGGPNDIHEASSSSFLTGNMGMAALNMMFYNELHDEVYKERALKTCQSLLEKYNDEGVLLDDRDGWTNGAFASYFASWVLSLDGTEELRDLCKATARSVIRNARTPDGYYGATWKGPSEGSLSIWWSGGTIPQQSATTGTAVSMVTSMAILEAGIKEYKR